MANGDVLPVGNRCDVKRRDSLQSIASIRQDFAALAEIFEQQLQVVSSSDDETRAHLRRAKAAAERGTELTDKLRELSQSSS